MKPKRHPTRLPHAPPLHADQKRRKEHLLTRRTPAAARDIAHATVIKQEDLFFLAEPDGCVPLESPQGFGLYYHDCRYLNGYHMTLGGQRPLALVANGAAGFSAIFELTNADIEHGRKHVDKEHVGIKWVRTLVSKELALYDVITVQNFAPETLTLPLKLQFSAAFEDVFKVRGLVPDAPGRLHDPAWDGDTLRFRYDGRDAVTRSLAIRFEPPPQRREAAAVEYELTLEPQATCELHVTVEIAESPSRAPVEPEPSAARDVGAARRTLERKSREAQRRRTGIEADDELLQHLIDRALGDLHMLRTEYESEEFFAAGVPWFATLFGRDSLISALQMLAFEPGIAAQTLRLLARHQGTKVDPWRDEEPGKILHEMRFGELARINAIPHTPYYGSVDSTPLFLTVLARHAQWTGSLELFDALRDNIERALEWIDAYGDADADGYLEYRSNVDRGLINQGWKDSGDAIVNDDGSLAQAPIALVEAQGYVYLAYRELAVLFERAGDRTRAASLNAAAAELRARFNRDYWLADRGHYALALQAQQRPVAVLGSNPGHALWSGIADDDKARATCEALLRADMWSGFGVRTLSQRERRYNPIGYHLGTVWPHDNAIIAAGFKRYGFDDAAERLARGIFAAATHFNTYRLPEVFAGFARADYGVPVRYPVANHPQAWAAGSVPYFLQTLLGLVPDGFSGTLHVIRPRLPRGARALTLRGVRLNDGSASLCFRRRNGGDDVDMEILEIEGDVRVVRDDAATFCA